MPDGAFTITAKTSEGRRVTFCFLEKTYGGPPRFIDIQFHDRGTTIPNADNGVSPTFNAFAITRGGRFVADSRPLDEDIKPSILVLMLDKAGEEPARSATKPAPMSDTDLALQGRSVTYRGIFVGAVMCAIMAVGIPYGSMVVQGTRLGLSSCTPAAFFLLFVLLLTLQIALGVIRRSWALSRAELVMVFIMMAVATAIPTRGVTGMLLPMITGTFYYDTPENNWGELIHPMLSDWMVVNNVTAVKQFYEGGSGSVPIPWDVWLPPLFRWFTFYAGFWLTLVCTRAILRRPWVDHERLVFPLAQLPLAMISDEDSGGASIVKPFFKNPIMWIGLAIPFLLNSINALSFYYPFITALNPVATVDLFRHSVILSLRVNYLMFGFAYFISSNISFSLWFSCFKRSICRW